MPATPEETIADEARRRPRAAIAAIAAAVLMMLGGVFSLPAVVATGLLVSPVYDDYPSDTRLLDALRERPKQGEPGAKARQVLFYSDSAPSIVGVALLRALSVAMIALALALMFRAIQARRPETRRAIVVALVAGAVLVAVGELASSTALVVEASAFADAATQSAEAAREVLSSTTFVAGLLLNQLGIFALSVAFILIALNGMRVGLLTRFMGVLGIIVGVLFIVPLQSTLPLVHVFWLGALGVLLLGRWPSGMPETWISGVAKPWPTQLEIREQRLAQRAERGPQGLGKPRSERLRRGRAEPPETPAPEPPKRPAHSSSKKRKRKRRG